MATLPAFHWYPAPIDWGAPAVAGPWRANSLVFLLDHAEARLCKLLIRRLLLSRRRQLALRLRRRQRGQQPPAELLPGESLHGVPQPRLALGGITD